MDLHDLPFPSRRGPVLAARCAVATSQHLAAQVGLRLLQDGGSAADAAVGMAATLTVVEPCSNGLGGDAFALVWDGARLHGLNGSGRAPAALTAEKLRDAGYSAVPTRGWATVTVPGAVRAWRDLHARFGRLPFAALLQPAIAAATEGFAVSPVVARAWTAAARGYGPPTRPEYRPWFDTFTRGGRAPAAGDVVTLPDHAAALARLAASGGDDLYDGGLAQRICAFAAQTGGYLAPADLAGHASEWVEPLCVPFAGHEVWEPPPNGQGLAALLALRILEGCGLEALPRGSIESYHLAIEAMKLAIADAHRYVADPAWGPVPTAELLSAEYAASRRALITDQAGEPGPGRPGGAGTVYLCAADADGMMISFIQSNYMGFGSGIVVPGAGIALQNRGAGFSLDPSHPNALAPGKRPFHTIIPGFLTRQGQPVGPFGVMGGPMQPQGHVQVLLDALLRGSNPQACLDAPRWQATGGRGVALERGMPPDIVAGLRARGHAVQADADPGRFGRGQAVWRLPSGALVAATDPRADGAALGW